MNINPSDYTAVGKLLKPFAVKGEIKVMPLTFDLDRHTQLKTVLIQSPKNENEVKELTVESVRVQQDLWFMKFAEITSPEEARLYNSWAILIPNNERLPLEEGEYYLSDLEGFTAFSENGSKIGIVKEVIEFPTANTFHIKGAAGDIMAPWIDECVLGIDDAEKTITLDIAFLAETYDFLKNIS